MVGTKIGEFVLKKGEDGRIIDDLAKKTTCNLVVKETEEGTRVSVYGDDSCKAMLKESNILK